MFDRMVGGGRAYALWRRVETGAKWQSVAGDDLI